MTSKSTLMALLTVGFLNISQAAYSQRTEIPLRPVQVYTQDVGTPPLAHADCSAPPFGDTWPNYTEMRRALASKPQSDLLLPMLETALQLACHVKFEHGDRSFLYQNRIMDQQIADMGTAQLANAWLAARNSTLDSHGRSPERTEETRSNRCKSPPYGDTDEAYREFVDKTQFLVIGVGASMLPTKILPPICRAKFEGADRTPYYNLGFTDRDIDSWTTTEFTKHWLLALKRLADKLPDE